MIPQTENSRLKQHELLPVELTRDQTIAVPAFANLTGDSRLSRFATDIAEGTAAILQITSGLLLSPSSEVQSARYQIIGKIRKGASGIRISVQLIDNFHGSPIWSDVFDHEGSQLRGGAEKFAQQIGYSVFASIRQSEKSDRFLSGTKNFAAWRKAAEALKEYQKYSPDSMITAAHIWDEAAQMDPDYLAARTCAACCYTHLALYAGNRIATRLIEKAEADFEWSVATAGDDPRPYAAKQGLELAKGKPEAAIEAAEIGAELAPEDTVSQGRLALAFMNDSEPEKALAQLDKAQQDASNPPAWFAMIDMLSNYMVGELKSALHRGRRAIAEQPEFYPAPVLAAAAANELGYAEEAHAMVSRVMRIDPEFRTKIFVQSQALKAEEHRVRLYRSLVAAGLPR